MAKAMLMLPFLLSMGCAPLPTHPLDAQGKRFERVPDRAVIYLVRSPLDSREISPLRLDGVGQLATLPGTYHRWELAPGTYQIAGVGHAHENLLVNAAAGGVYFIEHTVRGSPRSGAQITALRQVDEHLGRALLMQSQLRQ